MNFQVFKLFPSTEVGEFVDKKVCRRARTHGQGNLYVCRPIYANRLAARRPCCQLITLLSRMRFLLVTSWPQTLSVNYLMAGKVPHES